MVLSARKIPVTARELKNELKRLEDLKVIAPVDEPTEWVSQIVVAMNVDANTRA